MLRAVIRVQNYKNSCLRYFSAALLKQEGPLFPPKDDFPGRHIGPRDTDISCMLDTLGFKVKLLNTECLFYVRLCCPKIVSVIF